MSPRSVVIYTGGFPGKATLSAIQNLSAAANCPIFHWGDIDAGGIKIAHRIDIALAQIGKRLKLHLMSQAVAKEFGSPSASMKVFESTQNLNPEIREIADFLASSLARELEQEELDPIIPR
jgi:hypothetical protein